jgi:predicted DNA-binding transcriptional regulator AlpA
MNFPDDPITIGDARLILGVSRQRADELSRRADFPAPIDPNADIRRWKRAEVEEYARRREATAG